MPYFAANVEIPKRAGGNYVEGDALGRWNSLIEEQLEADTDFKATDFTQEGKLFFLNDDNKLVLLPFYGDERIRAGQQLSYARDGRLFLKNGNHLCQVQALMENGMYDICISNPFSDFSSVAAPERPSFWKYILYPFYADEIGLYNEQKDIYRALTTQEAFESFKAVRMLPEQGKAEVSVEEMPQQLGNALDENLIIENDQPALNDNQSKVEQDEEKKEQHEEEVLEANIQGGLKFNGKKAESLKDFWDKVTNAAERHTDIANLLKQSNVTQNTVVEYFYRIAEERAAQNLLSSVEKHPSGRDNAIIKHMDAYNAMLEGVRNMLPKMIGTERMQQILQYEWKADESENFDMLEMCDEIAENALKEYSDFLNKENGEKVNSIEGSNSLNRENEESAYSIDEDNISKNEMSNQQAIGMSAF